MIRNKLVLLSLILLSSVASATDLQSNLNIARQILNNSSTMSQVDGFIKHLAPTLKMKFYSISVDASDKKYEATLSYFSPSFGTCSVVIEGKISPDSSITADEVREDKCSE